MRTQLAGLTLVFGVIGLADLASIYVPGHIRDGIYIRPHFVSAPKPGRWPDQRRIGAPGPEPAPPRLIPEPERDPNQVGEAS